MASVGRTVRLAASRLCSGLASGVRMELVLLPGEAEDAEHRCGLSHTGTGTWTTTQFSWIQF